MTEEKRVTNKSIFLKSYRNQVKTVLKKKHPEWDEEFLKESIDRIIAREIKIPKATMENNYTHEYKETNLLSVMDWVIETKPIIAANGTFFKQHAVSKNPNALMVDGFLIKRKQIKGEMFAIGDESSRLYKMKDIGQGNEKRLANSYYGGSGMKASAFYNKFTAPCTTKSAQSVISTAETTFEAFLASNFNFVDINECYFWISEVLKENIKCEDWVVRKNIEDLYNRLAPAVLGAKDDDLQRLHEYLETLTEEEVTRLYWKNNLLEFTDTHQPVKDLWNVIFQEVKNYEYMSSPDDFSVVDEKYLERVKSAKEPEKEWANIVDHNYFYDPNDVPETIRPYVDGLKDIYMDYVYVEYMYTDRIYKLKNFRRDVVTVIDTDSNILSLDTFMDYCLENLKKGDYGRDNWNNVFIAINTLAYTITAVITKTLLYYGEKSNVEEKIRPRYSMKNEFFFANLILAKTKKRYLSKIILREGHRLKKPKYDIKGFDFKKASTSQQASEFFIRVVKELILDPEELDIRKIMAALRDFRKEVRKSIEEGDHKYLPLANAKELDAYDYPEREQSVRGALAWNIMYPDKPVDLPIKLSLLKTNIYSLDDIKELQTTDPEMYERIRVGIFQDTSRIFMRPTKDGKMKVDGLSVVGIPLYEKIPEWLLKYVDYNSVINAVLAPFKSVTETFNMPSIEEGRTGRKSAGFSNIIKL